MREKGTGMDPDNPTFYVSELYKSLQGESLYAGQKCLFLRLTGCNLRCTWCDSTFSFKGGKTMTLQELLAWAYSPEHSDYQLIEVTGGEPLAQKGTKLLLNRLVHFKDVLLETAGHMDISGIHPDVYIIMDVKCPGSGEEMSLLPSNLMRMRERGWSSSSGELKFVIADRVDFDYALGVIEKYQLDGDFLLTFSPVFGHLLPGELADWIIGTKLKRARLQIQMHKLCWTGKADFGMDNVSHVNVVDFKSGLYHVHTLQPKPL